LRAHDLGCAFPQRGLFRQLWFELPLATVLDLPD
jgi:hypothetical protein